MLVYSFVYFPVTEFNLATSMIVLINYFIRINNYFSLSEDHNPEREDEDFHDAIDSIVFFLIMSVDVVLLATYKLKTEVDRRQVM